MCVGIWMKVDPMFSHYLHVVDVAATNSLIDWAAWIFIVTGATTFFIAGVGICGACQESQCLIFLYIVMLFVMVAGEVVAASLSVVYRTEVENHLESQMKMQLTDDYYSDETTTDAWNFLQVQLQCCGATNYTDYEDSAWSNRTVPSNETDERTVPDQCCILSNDDYVKPKPSNSTLCQTDAADGVTTSHHLHVEGCYDNLMDWFRQHSTLMIALGFGIASIQLLGFVAACCLRRQIRTHIYDKERRI